MTIGGITGRALVAAAFVHGGWGTLLDPDPRVKAAAPLLARARKRFPALPSDEALVKAQAAVHVGAGLLLAAGVCTRPAARILALSLIPTTAAGHPFWEADNPGQRSVELIQVVKNAALGGALLLASATGQPAAGRR